MKIKKCGNFASESTFKIDCNLNSDKQYVDDFTINLLNYIKIFSILLD